MIALITNYGKTRALPTCIGNVHITGRTSIELNTDLDSRNEKAIEELSAFPFVDVEIIFENRKPAEAQEPPKIDYSKYSITELRSIGAAVGIAGFFTMRKAVLIKALEET